MMKRLLRNILLLGLAVGCLLPQGRAADTAEADKSFQKLEARSKDAKTLDDWRQLATRCAAFGARFPEHVQFQQVLRMEHGALCRVLTSNPPADDPIHARLAVVEPELLKRYQSQPEQQFALRQLHLGFTPPLASLSSPEGREKRLKNIQLLATEFPSSPKPYDMLLQLAEASPPAWRDKIAHSLADNPRTPEAVKRKAQALLENPQRVKDQQFAAQVANSRKRLAAEPKDASRYRELLHLTRIAAPAEALELTREIVAMKQAPSDVHDQAVAQISQLEQVGRPFNLKCRLVSGDSFDLEKLRGKVLVIDFWAVWCKPCIAEMPVLIELYRRKKDEGLVVLGYSLDNNEAAPEGFVKLNKIPYPVYCEGNGFSGFAANNGITSIPTLWLIDKQGVLRDVNGRDRLEEKVERLLAE